MKQYMFRFVAALSAVALTLSLSTNASAQFKSETAAPAASATPQSEIADLKAQRDALQKEKDILLNSGVCGQPPTGAPAAPPKPKPASAPTHHSAPAPKKPTKFVCDAAQTASGQISEDGNFCRCSDPAYLVPVLVHPTENVIACVARAEVYKYIVDLQGKYTQLNDDLRKLLELIGDPDAFRKKMEQIATMASDIEDLKAHDADQDAKLAAINARLDALDKHIKDLEDAVAKARGSHLSIALGGEGGFQTLPGTTPSGILQAYTEIALQANPKAYWAFLLGGTAGMQTGSTLGTDIRLGADIGLRRFLDDEGKWAIDFGAMGYTAMSGELPRNFGPGWPFKLSGVEGFVGPRVMLGDNAEARLRCGLGGATVDYTANGRFQQSDGLTGHCTIGAAYVFGDGGR